MDKIYVTPGTTLCDPANFSGEVIAQGFAFHVDPGFQVETSGGKIAIQLTAKKLQSDGTWVPVTVHPGKINQPG